MRFVRGREILLGLIAGVLVLVPGQSPSDAQQLGGVGQIAVPFIGGQSPLLRQTPILDQGWAEVLTVTSKWLVIQNAQGQQYPIAFDSIQMFIARWPMQIGRIPENSLVEATGPDTGDGALRTTHVDVYVGGARTLVTPTYFYINGNGHIISQIDFMTNPQAYGDPYPGIGSPIQGGVLSGVIQVHVVGPPTSRIPLRLNTPGNSGIGVLPTTPAGLTATEITPGTSSILKPGDPVYFVASSLGAKSVVLSQLVVYKQVPSSD